MRLHVLLSLLAAYLLLSQRLFVRFETGGSGILQLLSVILPIAALTLVVPHRRGRAVARLLNAPNWWPVAAFGALATVLPMLGVMVGTYPAATLLAVLDGVLPVSFVLIGVYCALEAERFQRWFPQYFVALCLFQAVISLGQFSYEAGITSGQLLSGLRRWDMAVQEQYKTAYVLTGRSIGTFVNPNALGIWSGLALLVGAYALHGPSRVIACAAAVCSLLLSQSRGSLVAVVSTFAVVGGRTVWLLLVRRGGGRRVVEASFGAPAAIVAFGLILVLSAGAFSENDVVTNMLDRYQRVYSVIVEGTIADKNLLARTTVWQNAIAYAVENPLGTLGPPQVRFRHSIDNEYLRLLLQGGVLHLFSFIAVLALGARMVAGSDRMQSTVGAMSIALAFIGLSALPLGLPAVGLYWVLLGYVMAARRPWGWALAGSRAIATSLFSSPSARAVRGRSGGARFRSARGNRLAEQTEITDPLCADANDGTTE